MSPEQPGSSRGADGSRGTGRSRGVSALALLLALVALGLGSWINEVVPSVRDRVQDPFLRPGAVGERIELRDAWVEVTAVDGAPELRTIIDTTASSGHGTWALLDVRYEGRARPVAVSDVSIVAADGRTYAQAGSQAPGGCSLAQPHQLWQCQVAIEMPADALDGAVARIPLNGSVRGDAVAEVDLGITGTIAARWQDAAQPLVMTGGGALGEDA